MYTLFALLHVVFALALILIVLLQTGKGSDLASAFGGGGAQTVFGSAGTASFLNRITTLAAILFMVTSLVLAVLSGSAAEGTGLDLPGPIEEAVTDVVVPDAEEGAAPADEMPAAESLPDPVTVPEDAPAGGGTTAEGGETVDE